MAREKTTFWSETEEAWWVLKTAYRMSRGSPRRDIQDCLPNGLTGFERELIIAAFYTGRQAHADDVYNSAENNRPVHPVEAIVAELEERSAKHKVWRRKKHSPKKVG